MFKSYLSLHKQVVRIGSVLSNPLPGTLGVTQASILGPVLFTLYVNELLSAPKKCEAMGYVDDTKLLLAIFLRQTSVLPFLTSTNTDPSEVAKWCSINSLLINPISSLLLEFLTTTNTKLIFTSCRSIGKEHQALSCFKRFGSLDRLCRNFRRLYS